MAYLSRQQLEQLGFAQLGKNVKISSLAAIYNHSSICIKGECRIDDFCVVSGNVSIGKFVHITPMCLVAGGQPGITLQDYSTLAYGVKIFSQSDDYSGQTMVNSLIPKHFKNECFSAVQVGMFAVIGTNAVVMPGAHIAEGCAIGASALVTKPTEPWGIYAGIPARRIKDRSKNLLEYKKAFELLGGDNDSV